MHGRHVVDVGFRIHAIGARFRQRKQDIAAVARLQVIERPGDDPVVRQAVAGHLELRDVLAIAQRHHVLVLVGHAERLEQLLRIIRAADAQHHGCLETRVDQAPAVQALRLHLQHRLHLAVDRGIAARLQPGIRIFDLIEILQHAHCILVARPRRRQAVAGAVIGNLLQQHHFAGTAAAIIGLELFQHDVEVAIRRGRRITLAFHHQRPGHAAGDLHRRRAMLVRVIPERAGRMVDGNIVFILEIHTRLDRYQHIVAIARRRHPQAVRMQIGVVEAAARARRIDIGGRALLGRQRLQAIMQLEAHGLPRRHHHRGRHEGGGMLVATIERQAVRLLIGAQAHLVMFGRGRVINAAVGIADVQVIRLFKLVAPARRAVGGPGARLQCRRLLQQPQLDVGHGLQIQVEIQIDVGFRSEGGTAGKRHGGQAQQCVPAGKTRGHDNSLIGLGNGSMGGHAYFFICNIAIIHNDKESILTLSHLLFLLLRGH